MKLFQSDLRKNEEKSEKKGTKLAHLNKGDKWNPSSGFEGPRSHLLSRLFLDARCSLFIDAGLRSHLPAWWVAWSDGLNWITGDIVTVEFHETGSGAPPAVDGVVGRERHCLIFTGYSRCLPNFMGPICPRSRLDSLDEAWLNRLAKRAISLQISCGAWDI